MNVEPVAKIATPQRKVIPIYQGRKDDAIATCALLLASKHVIKLHNPFRSDKTIE